jgi:Carboxypeptidase regulatory-like domain
MQTNTPRIGQTARALATGLWLAALFLIGLLIFYLPAFHQPVPHHVKVAIAASPTATARLQHELDVVAPCGFTLWPAARAAAARSAVQDLSAVAAYVPDGRHLLLYGAKADGAALETVIRDTFAVVAGQAGGTLVFRELVPTVPGDAVGTSPLYLVLACIVPAYFMVVGMQRAVGFGRRAHVATIVGWGAVAAVFSYLLTAYAVHAIPQRPLDLLYLFLLTQAVSLPSYGLVPFAGPFLPLIAIPLFILLGVPTSGGAVPVQLVPGVFRFFHPILPMGNGIDALRSVDYFGSSQLLRPTVVLCAWIVAGAVLILLGYLKQQQRTAQEAAEQPLTEPVPEPSEEAPAVGLPEPVALTPHEHRLGDEKPMLIGRVTDPSGQPLPDASVTVTDLHGRQLVRTRTDRSGEYAATGFSDLVVVVLATMPGRRSAVAQLLLSSVAPVNQDFVLDAPTSADSGAARGV